MLIEAEFKRPVLVPTTMHCNVIRGSNFWVDVVRQQGFRFSVSGKDVKDVVVGCIKRCPCTTPAPLPVCS